MVSTLGVRKVVVRMGIRRTTPASTPVRRLSGCCTWPTVSRATAQEADRGGQGQYPGYLPSVAPSGTRGGIGLP